MGEGKVLEKVMEMKGKCRRHENGVEYPGGRKVQLRWKHGSEEEDWDGERGPSIAKYEEML